MISKHENSKSIWDRCSTNNNTRHSMTCHITGSRNTGVLIIIYLQKLIAKIENGKRNKIIIIYNIRI